MTAAGGVRRSITKIQRHKTSLLAFVGDVDIAQELMVWFKSGARRGEFPDSARGGASTLIQIKRDASIWNYDSGPVPTKIENAQAAFGSGFAYAEATMHLGYSAREAVLVACHFQPDCGDGVDTLDLHKGRTSVA